VVTKPGILRLEFVPSPAVQARAVYEANKLSTKNPQLFIFTLNSQ
jgi:hypothetical protein